MWSRPVSLDRLFDPNRAFLASSVKRAKRVDESESYGQQNNVLNAIFSVDFNGLEIRDRGFG